MTFRSADKIKSAFPLSIKVKHANIWFDIHILFPAGMFQCLNESMHCDLCMLTPGYLGNLVKVQIFCPKPITYIV